MNINEIIKELKTFSDEDIIKFNKVFSDFYKPYKKKENEIKKKLKKQKEELQKAEAIKAGDKLCEIYGINAYPISIVHIVNQKQIGIIMLLRIFQMKD